MRNLTLTLAAAALLAACGPQQPAETEPAAPAPAVESAAVVGPVLITFSEAGAGEIDAATPLTVEAVESRFPAATVEKQTIEGDGVYEQITVRREDGLALDLMPGGDPAVVGVIRGHGGPVVGPGGEQLGASWAELDFDPAACVRGMETLSGTLICYRQGAPHLGYVFDLPSWQGPDDAMPDGAFLESNARLSAFLWTASAA
ncbi:MAG: DUF1131 family protein [Pseudomonadota bacterium]